MMDYSRSFLALLGPLTLGPLLLGQQHLAQAAEPTQLATVKPALAYPSYSRCRAAVTHLPNERT